MSAFRAVDLIRAVRDGVEVEAAAIGALVAGIVEGTVPDYQASAFLMAACLRGLSPATTVALTHAMRASGETVDLDDLPGPKVDKHSTGGVGDKVSLSLAPLVAAAGAIVPMVAGRGLGHTGGTLDKLEAIPGFRVDLGLPHFRATLARVGASIMGQTAAMAPADRILYALRDVTATVESVPLITASILAKKLAEGTESLVLDVKVGAGAFMRDVAQAQALAQSLVDVGRGAGLTMRALITRMDAPLGHTVGNALEVREAIDVLHGRGPADVVELTLALGAEMLCLAGLAADVAAARALLSARIADGAAAERLRLLVAAHGGNPDVVDAPDRHLPVAPYVTTLRAPHAGAVAAIDGFAVGQLVVRLGGGRARADDRVDPAVGVVLPAPVGTLVAAGTPLAHVHHRTPDAAAALATLAAAITLAPAPVAAIPLIRGSI